MKARLATIGDYLDPVSNWNPATRPATELRYLDLSAVSQAEKTITSASSIVGSQAPSRARQLLKEGDVLVSTVRPNLNGVALVTNDYDGATASTGFCVLRPRHEKLSSKYLMQWVRSPLFVDLMVRQATGASYPAVTDRVVKGSLMPLPPLSEQRRIAALLDKADELRRKRKRAIELLDSLTQSIFLEMFGDPVGEAQNSTQILGTVIEKIESGWSPVCLDRVASENEAGVLKLGAITGGSFVASENKALPSNLTPKAGTEISAGDILLCRKNTKELVGSSAYVWETRPLLHMSDLIFRIVPKRSLIDPIFLQAQLALPSQRRRISDMSGGAAGSMPNVSRLNSAN